MTNRPEQLMRIAQRLDELAEDGPSELTALSEELGVIADAWPVEKREKRPRWMEEIEHLFRQAVEEEVFLRSRGPHDYRATLDLQRYYRGAVDPMDAIKFFADTNV
jgi:hypothetical protein